MRIYRYMRFMACCLVVLMLVLPAVDIWLVVNGRVKGVVVAATLPLSEFAMLGGVGTFVFLRPRIRANCELIDLSRR